MRVKCKHKFENGERCGYEWETKGKKLPKSCPRCKQYGKVEEVRE